MIVAHVVLHVPHQVLERLETLAQDAVVQVEDAVLLALVVEVGAGHAPQAHGEVRLEEEHRDDQVEQQQPVVEAPGQDVGIGQALLVAQRRRDVLVDVEVLHGDAQQLSHLAHASDLGRKF